MRFWVGLLMVHLVLGNGPVWATPLEQAAQRAWQTALQALQQEDWPTALTALHRTVALPPQYTAQRQAALHNRCLVYIQIKRYQLAIADCQAALAHQPTEAAFLNRGIAHYRLHQFPEALADFTEALRLAPHSAEAWLNRALVYLTLGNRSQAHHDLHQAACCCDRRSPLHRYIRQTLEALTATTITV